MTNDTYKKTAQFQLRKEYGFAPGLDDIEIVKKEDTAYNSFLTFKVGGHTYHYDYNECELKKLDGQEQFYRNEAKKYFDKWYAAIA